MGRPATPEDIDVICASSPDPELGTSWGDRPTWKVLLAKQHLGDG